MMQTAVTLPATLLLLAIAAHAGPTPRERIARLENSLLAPCCYSETLARHSSEVARKMRTEIARWVGEGKSDREIQDTYKGLYGARVLAEPEGSVWWWSVAVPAFAVLLGTLATLWLVCRMRRAARGSAAAAPPPDVRLPDFLDD
jgi:cytochrome c-type biogenesis protein CcmH/NrfF